MAYQTFLISDFMTGLYEVKEPWKAPADAFTNINNMYIRRGKIQKRLGYNQYAQMNHYQKAITGITNANPGVVTSASHGLSNGTSVLIYDVAGMTEVNGNTYTVANAATNTFELSGTNTTDYTPYTSDGKIATFQTNAITGIKEFDKIDGSKELLVFDEKRVAKYNTTNEVLEDIAESDVFTGDEDDLFWLTNFTNKAYFTNAVDRIKSWDGTTLATPDLDIDGDTSNDIGTCLIILPFKERLVLFKTTEDGTLYPQRARWSRPADPTVWDDTISNGGGYIDAPTGDFIVSATPLKDMIIVFFEKSTWAFKYTGNVDLPFRWEKLDSSMKIDAPHSVITFQDQAWVYGATGFVGTNGFTNFRIDTAVPDITLETELDKVSTIYAHIYDEYEQAWILKTSSGGTTKDGAWIWNYKEGNWTEYDVAFNCMGSYQIQNDQTWDTETRTWDEIEERWDDTSGYTGFPITLAGDYSGNVRRIYWGSADNSSDISLELLSARWNPFLQQGKRAKLGSIAFLVDRNDTETCSVEFYIDTDATAYQTSTLDLSSTAGTEDKVWRRLYSGAIGDTHRIKITNTGNQTITFHAFELKMEEAGDIA